MSKYDPLSARLASLAGSEWPVSFSELEAVLGFPLPKSARLHRAWWGNEAAPNQPHKKAWLDHGWHAAEVDPSGEKVTFRRIGAGAPAPIRPATTTGEPAILQRLEASPKWGVALIAGGVAVVAGLGALAIRGLLRRSK